MKYLKLNDHTHLKDTYSYKKIDINKVKEPKGV